MFTWKDTDGFIHGVAFDAIEILDQDKDYIHLGLSSNNMTHIPAEKHKVFMSAYNKWLTERGNC